MKPSTDEEKKPHGGSNYPKSVKRKITAVIFRLTDFGSYLNISQDHVTNVDVQRKTGAPVAQWG